jgi:hypothetical protein
MISDSIIFVSTLPDTLRIVNLSPPPLVPTEYLALLGVILGASISIIGNLMLAKRQARNQIQNTFFSRRLEVYIRLAEISWEGYSVRVKSDPGEEEGVYPQAYDTFQHLRDWLNSMVELTDKNRLLLDQSTYTAFTSLNHKILLDLDKIRSLSQSNTIDWQTRSVGRKSLPDIQKLSEALVDATRRYIGKTYRVKVEKVL